MANVDTLTFTSVPLDTLGLPVPLTTYSGALTVDYTTGNVTGSLQVAPALGIDLTNYSNFTLTPGAGNTYTITGTGQTLGLVNSTISIQYTGQTPTSVSTQYFAAGLELASGTNGPVTSTPVCFAAGTMIRTDHGDVAIERLEIGDMVLTASGAHRPIRWLGHRIIDCRDRSNPGAVWPIRIVANAFGPNRPERDLLLSPGHSVCVDVFGDVLIPASSLVNGSTVTQVEVDEISYWHVELDSHDVIFANGMQSETYLEMGNRGFFKEADATKLQAVPDAPVATHDDFCRPFAAEGVVVQVVREKMRAIAVAMGWTLTEAPLAEMHLIVDDERLYPVSEGLTARFIVPADARNVWLVSRTSVPAMIGKSLDDRSLGLCVRQFTIDDGVTARREIAASDPMLCVGFHGAEDEGSRRWTAGRAKLPAELWQGCRDVFFLRVELDRPALSRWTAPASGRQPRAEDGRHLSLVEAA